MKQWGSQSIVLYTKARSLYIDLCNCLILICSGDWCYDRHRSVRLVIFSFWRLIRSHNPG
ncbi:hypothetical protein D9H76_24510 [Escherichia coli]|nr:hypothetical protein [Escherichia coli]EFN4374024.1 hypothetical protein [Escherichia coli]EFN4422097.1 hypothetical protein [Escherichia coli]EFN5058848.1 hypothetical protein [Escherichia coli]EFN5073698.1 hypothetical protein [Escherichia coli]